MSASSSIKLGIVGAATLAALLVVILAQRARHAEADSGSTMMQTTASMQWQRKHQAQSGIAEASTQPGAANDELVAWLSEPQRLDILAPEKLARALPVLLDGLQRTQVSSERDVSTGLAISTAKALYSGDGERTVTVELSDLGGGSTVVAFAAWALSEQSYASDQGYEKSFHRGRQAYYERWDAEQHFGEHAMLIKERFLVRVHGTAQHSDDLARALRNIDLDTVIR